jgi:D-lactate dehydrogenase
MFDFRNSEKDYFKEKSPKDLEIEFITEPLDNTTQLSEAQKIETVVVSVFITSKLTSEVLSQFKNIQVIATRSTGYNHIDLEYCRTNNITVLNVPDYGKTSVAQYTIGMILNLTRNVVTAVKDIKTRKLNYSKYEGRNLTNLSLGVIGTGSIGSAVCELAHMFGMEIYAYDLTVNEEIRDYVEYLNFEELLSKSDIISLHMPYIPDFYHMIKEKEVNLMKDNVYIINTSRGELIDISAIYKGIQSGKIKGAALDVLECENLNYETEEITNAITQASEHCLETAVITDKLLQYDNVIITPHIAYNTKESVMNILDSMFISIKEHYIGGRKNRVV